jgi:hypothetical protein
MNFTVFLHNLIYIIFRITKSSCEKYVLSLNFKISSKFVFEKKNVRNMIDDLFFIGIRNPLFEHFIPAQSQFLYPSSSQTTSKPKNQLKTHKVGIN